MTNREDSKTNLTILKWAHAANSQEQLIDALNSDIDFIEADIVMGQLNNTGIDIPIMAHPPAKSSDLSLDSFLLQIQDYNKSNARKMKGIKLDFKSIEVFEGALATLKEKIPEMNYPIWLNADIIAGPVDEPITTPVNAKRFFVACAQFEKAVLSIGWTTKWTSSANNGSYTHVHTNAMLEAIKDNNILQSGQSITFPVRAGIAANSLSELRALLTALNDTNECTLTIWSSENDFVDVGNLRKLIFALGFDRVYLDVPEKLYSQLDLWRTEDADLSTKK